MVPPVTMMPLVTPEVVPVHDKVLIVFWLIVGVVPEVVIPTTVAVVLVEDRVLMVLEVILAVPGNALLIPVTAPPVPVELRPVIVFEAIFNGNVAVPLLPTNNPVIVPVPVMLVIVLVDMVVVLPKLACSAFTALEPQVQLLKVFPVMVF